MNLVDIVTTSDIAVRDMSLDYACNGQTAGWLMAQAEMLDQFRRRCGNLYERVRAILFLSAIHRFHLPRVLPPTSASQIPFEGVQQLLMRRFVEGIDTFLTAQRARGLSDALCSALAQAYRGLAFQTLADQVRRSVRSVRGNQWMFRIGHSSDHPLRLRSELLARDDARGPFPILAERTSVRMDFTHSGWSDIFFLGMDYPEGARVINVSIDLAVHGRDPQPKPPIETFLRVIEEPILRLVSTDLDARADISHVDELFDFARDYLGLLKAAVIASGIVPPGMEGSGQPIEAVMQKLIGPGFGLEIASNVNDIPKGSRLAVSTNLLGSLIAVCMRASGQVSSLSGPLTESDRRIVAARAILGEWLGGSGGGWQDSGGIWPGIKLITGSAASEGDPEFGISRGRLLPRHEVFSDAVVTEQTRQRLSESLVLVHGGMAQNVGPILEMVTEKYLLRSGAEWTARQSALGVIEQVIDALRRGDIQTLGTVTSNNFFGPLQTIIPWCTNAYTEALIQATRTKFAQGFWGFWMLGGMAGGGMGFIFDPAIRKQAQDWLWQEMRATKQRMQYSLPFAMEPVTYDFAINDRGTTAELLTRERAWMPDRYYVQTVPDILRRDPHQLTPAARSELERFATSVRRVKNGTQTISSLIDRMLPQSATASSTGPGLMDLLDSYGFDREQHEQIRADLRAGRIGMAQNRLPPSTLIEDVRPGDVSDTECSITQNHLERGAQAIAAGQVAVVTLAAGIGSRWTQGAGVVKALHPFCRLKGRHRTFLEVHLAKSRKIGGQFQCDIPHIITTSHLTHEPTERELAIQRRYGYPGPLYLSRGRSIGLRTIPMVRDLRFAWEEMPQQLLDEQQEKMRSSVRLALLQWAQQASEGSDYTDNVPSQCLHPVGHWYEIPNMLRNGTLADLLEFRPELKYLMLHNIDTLGADVSPGLLGLHIEQANCVSFELIRRRLEDRGGGLARVDGQVRLVEGLAMPREEDEFSLSYYNTLTTWIDIDLLLSVFGIARGDLRNQPVIDAAVRKLSRRIPAYVTIKEVKRRWGFGQEDTFPVSQFEKIWGDISALPEVQTGYFVVSHFRGQQLKEQSQLDGWVRDGSAAYVESLCDFGVPA